MHTEAAGVDKVAIVKESLFNFITSHVPNADLSAIDDIILSYVQSAIEVAPSDLFTHVTDFMDMMSAYVADFNKIGAEPVCVWMLGLGSMLAEKQQPVNEPDVVGAQGVEDKENINIQSINDAIRDIPSKPSRSNSSSEDVVEKVENGLVIIEDDEDEKVEFLLEMFPHSAPIEIRHCLSIAKGDIDGAIATVLHRRDHGQALAPAHFHSVAKVISCDDSEIKSRIIARYSYVDKESETKEHKPLAPKHEPKKMVRYRDNKIVSLKGERYTEISKGDDEGVKKSNKKHHP